jgi:putative MATE family efflux protein
MILKKIWQDKTLIKEIWALSWPMALIMLFEFFIGLSDVYVAGKFGKEIQAAYGLAFQLYFVFIIIGMALSVGIVSVASRLYTSKNSVLFNTAVSSSLVVVTASGIIFGILGVLFSKNLIQILNIPPPIKIHAIPFLTIYSLGFVFDYILMSFNGVLRACAMIKKSLWVMSVVCAMNVGLNFFLAFGTPLGYQGIAVATVISLFAGCVLSIPYIRVLITKFKFSLEPIKEVLNISWPSGLLQVFWQLASVVLFLILSLLPYRNIEILAALTNGLKIESVIFLPAFAFNMVNAVVVGNWLGKRDKENAFRGGLGTAVMGVLVVTVLTVMVIFNARRVAGFLSSNPVVIDECVRYVYISLISEPIMAWGVILGGGLNGAGDTKSVMLASAFSVWFIRIPLSYVLAITFGFGAVAVWWSMNISNVIQAIIISKRYFGKRWMKA